MPIITSLTSLNPDTEKVELMHRPFIRSAYDIARYEDYRRGFVQFDINVSNKTSVIAENIRRNFYSNNNGEKLSDEVRIQALNVLDMLYPNMLVELDEDDIYITDYGTLIFDWEKDIDNVFSLELGAEHIGYFIEVDGIDEKQVDVINLEDAKESLLKDLNRFLERYE